MRPPFSYVGGKSRLAKRLRKFLPKEEYVGYVEPFGGSFGFGLSLPHVKQKVHEVYNDQNEDLVNFMEIARTRTEELIDQLAWVPYSRALYKRWWRQYVDGEFPSLDPLDRAVRWFSASRMAFSSWLHPDNQGWGFIRDLSSAQWQPRRFRNSAYSTMRKYAKRIELVQIECRDFTYMFEKYDGPKTLFYVDPPYYFTQMSGSGGNDYYDPGNPWTLEDEDRLLEACNSVEGMVMISNYDDPKLRERYTDGWNWYEIPNVHVGSAGPRTEARKRKATELVITNYDADI